MSISDWVLHKRRPAPSQIAHASACVFVFFSSPSLLKHLPDGYFRSEEEPSKAQHTTSPASSFSEAKRGGPYSLSWSGILEHPYITANFASLVTLRPPCFPSATARSADALDGLNAPPACTECWIMDSTSLLAAATWISHRSKA
eukprot:CAMPEP_0179035320 /NCGR_PEP_ID=MMETSP0796-20121207/13051_1 /TAXON_ID=73915 /ORGANISM="Pyrodinium bahamense, Strain pbaha01" /LENGTH=143 /DNA_ID=CAMNT_0020731591 /DNA_START=946 /DNA_END=1377 /DNA_ORIENTATION=-